MDILYKRIKERREYLGYTQEQMAEKLGYKSRSSINKIELGLNDLPQSKISEFAKVLKTTPAYLMGWEHNTLDDKVRDLVIKIRQWLNTDLDEIHSKSDGKVTKNQVLAFEQETGPIDYGFLINYCKALNIDFVKVIEDSNFEHTHLSEDSGFYDNLSEKEFDDLSKPINNYEYYINAPSTRDLTVDHSVLDQAAQNELVLDIVNTLVTLSDEELKTLKSFVDLLKTK